MKHLRKYAELGSLAARLVVIGAHVPLIILMLVLNILEAAVRAFHEVAVQLLVSLSNVAQAFTNQTIGASRMILADVVATARGEVAPRE